jgi:TRAP-type mannitol/chloroaromatic compound transport system permease large subunit
MTALWRGVLPFVAADIVRIGVIVAFPIVVLWLPQNAF